MTTAAPVLASFTVLEEGADGGSLTTVQSVELEPHSVVPGEEPLYLSAPVPVSAVVFVEIAQGVLDSEFHNAPREQFIVVLQGRLRSETTDGAVSYAGPGDILLVRDVAGAGHRASVLESPLRVLFLPVAGPQPAESSEAARDG
jgi:quercetin dioxygenase-like cupin family protein